MTGERVHRKDNSARFKDKERWLDKKLTGESVGLQASKVIEARPAKKRRVIKET